MGVYWTQEITVKGTKKDVKETDSGKNFYLEITSGKNTFQSESAGVVILGTVIASKCRAYRLPNRSIMFHRLNLLQL